MHVGLSLPVAGEDMPVTDLAVRAEELDFDSVWVGDHLADGRPMLEAVVALSAAAAVTRRVRIGTSIMQLGLRNLGWTAKQLGSLQYLAGNRLILGVGAGGTPAGEWEAIGLPVAGRGRRTDRALAALRPLLRGEPVELVADGPALILAPAVTPPPIWIGGESTAAFRRVLSHGDGWLAAPAPRAEIAQRAQALRDRAAELGRSAPTIAAMVLAASTADGTADPGAGLRSFLTGRLGLSAERAAATAVAGVPEQVAEQLAGYAALGVEHVVVAPFGADWREQFDLLAKAHSLLAG